MPIHTRILKNRYHDSVTLMLATRTLKEQPQVVDAAYMMGTEVNKALLDQGGLLSEEADLALANDLIITINGSEETAQYLDLAEELLTLKTKSDHPATSSPGTFRRVIKDNPQANLAIISVAGAYAAKETREALTNGLHVLLFSDNVSLADEIALKKLALQNGLLLMGPGAGTAIINGVGLGFANAVPQGQVGIVSAAGTGLQEVSTLLAKQGLGISQGIGTGGRDLSAPVGGLMFFASMDALQADEKTQVIVLISKPPHPNIAENLFNRIKNSPKPIVMCLLGAARPEDLGENIHFTRTLDECALVTHAIVRTIKKDISASIEEQDKWLRQKSASLKKMLTPEKKYIRGLFSGGTLCYEAQVIWRDLLSDPVFSNAPLDKALALQDSSSFTGHCALDLGEEEFTLGRPHPMIDNDLRIQYIKKAASDPQTAVIILDLVIGYGAHPDPATALGQVIRGIIRENESKGHPLIFVASVTGTTDDPQNLEKSQQVMQDAGVLICNSNAQAARLAALLVEKRTDKAQA